MRTPVTVKIKFKSPSLADFIERYAVDVSKAGIFIRTPKPLSVGTALNFEFQLQDGSPLLSGSGTVVWVRDQTEKQTASPGMGVRFDDLPAASKDVLTRVLKQKTEAALFGEPAAAAASQAEPPADMPADDDEPPEPLFPEPLSPEPLHPEPKAAAAAPKPAATKPADRPPRPEAVMEPREPAPRKQPKDAAAKGKDNLGEMLFEDDTGVAVADGAKPIAPEPAKRRTPTPPATVATSAKPVTATEERKSSPVGWVIILLLILAAGGWYWWKYYGPGKTPAVQPAAAADAGMAARPDLAPAPKPKVALKVESTPEGAKILVDGKDTGKVTPAEIAELDPEAEVEIALDLAGKKLHHGKVKPAADTPYTAELTAAAARKIRITSEPPGATIHLDGAKLGTTPFDLVKELKRTRSYKVKVSLDGYGAFETKLTPAELVWTRDGDDELGTVSATLEKKAAPAPAKRRRGKTKKPDDDTGDTGDTDGADPEPADAPEPAKPAPPEPAPEGTPPAKGGIKKPSWSN